MLGCKGLRKKEWKSNNSPNFPMKVFIAVLLIQQNLNNLLHQRYLFKYFTPRIQSKAEQNTFRLKPVWLVPVIVRHYRISRMWYRLTTKRTIKRKMTVRCEKWGEACATACLKSIFLHENLAKCVFGERNEEFLHTRIECLTGKCAFLAGISDPL